MKKYIIILGIFSLFAGIFVFNSTKQEEIVVNGQIPLKTKLELIDESEVIVRGKVSEIKESNWSNPELIKGEHVPNILQTDIVVNIEDIYKGIPMDSGKVTVRIGKGFDKKVKFISEGYPDFKVGEEVILMLAKDDGDYADPDENYYVLCGMIQGKYSLKGNIDSDKIYKNDFDENTFKLSTVKEEIKNKLDYLKHNPLPKMTKEEIRMHNKKSL